MASKQVLKVADFQTEVHNTIFDTCSLRIED